MLPSDHAAWLAPKEEPIRGPLRDHRVSLNSQMALAVARGDRTLAELARRFVLDTGSRCKLRSI